MFSNVYVKTKKILYMMKVTTDEHVQDNKASPELVENIIESDRVTTIGKLFADDNAYEGNDIFRYLADNGILPCIKVRERMLDLDGKKGTSLEICQFWHKEMI